MTPEDLEQIRHIVREEIQAAMKPTAPRGLMTETGSLISAKEFSGEPVADIADPFRKQVVPSRLTEIPNAKDRFWHCVTHGTVTLTSAEQTETRA